MFNTAGPTIPDFVPKGPDPWLAFATVLLAYSLFVCVVVGCTGLFGMLTGVVAGWVGFGFVGYFPNFFLSILCVYYANIY